MTEFTFLKIEVDDSSFTTNTPSSGHDADGETDVTVGEDTREEDSSGPGKAGLLAAVVGLVFLVGVGVLLRRYLSEDGLEETDEAVVTVD